MGGRYIDAHQTLLRLEAADMNPQLVERVRRICAQYSKSIKMLNKNIKDLATFELNEKLRLQWGVELKNGRIYFRFSVLEPDLDIIRAFAAMHDPDLLTHFNPAVEGVERLGGVCSHDTFHRIFTTSSLTRTKADNVTIVNALDALDLSSGALWVCNCTPSESAAHAQGWEIPQCRKGFSRSTHLCQFTTFTPLAKGGDKTRGYEMRMVMECVLPKLPLAVLNMMPGIVLKACGRSVVEDLTLKFRNFVRDSSELGEHLKPSPHVMFYEQLRHRLERK